MDRINRIGVVGAGMMGAEIALCFAKSGCKVHMKETSLDLARKGKERLIGVLDKSVKRGAFPMEEKDPTLTRLIPTDRYEDLTDVDLVVEAVFEDFEIKKDVFGELEKVCRAEAVFATNTSSIPITLLATCVGQKRIGRFVGAHFFSPASIMRLVEVIPGLETEDETVEMMMECCRAIGKTPIRVKDVTGFAVNRILHAMWIEANRLLEEEVASPEDVDIACKLGLGHPIGPYALMDLTGNDLNLMVQRILYDSYGERFRPRPILKQKVDAGHLGRKSGKGWYVYNK